MVAVFLTPRQKRPTYLIPTIRLQPLIALVANARVQKSAAAAGVLLSVLFWLLLKQRTTMRTTTTRITHGVRYGKR